MMQRRHQHKKPASLPQALPPAPKPDPVTAPAAIQLGSADQHELIAYLQELGTSQDEATRIEQGIQTYIGELSRWNPRLGLVEAEGRELLVRHVFDCLAPLPVFRALLSPLPGAHRSTLADIGSGAGLPGLLLAIAFPDLQVTLCERQGRRCGFLRNAAAVLRTLNAQIEEGELEKLLENNFDLVTARAFKPLEPSILLALRRILKPDGLLVLYKGKHERIVEECTDAGLQPLFLEGDWLVTRSGSGTTDGKTIPATKFIPAPGSAVVIKLHVPELDEERHVVIVGKF